MQEIIETLFEQLNEHWIKFVTAGLFMAAGWYLGKWRARAQWEKKEFLHRLNISLNVIRDGKLLIRTIIEKSCDEVFLNRVAADTVNSAARKTDDKNPILPLPKDDYWYYLNGVLNEVAEKFSEGELKRDLQLPVTSERYLISLTCERAGPVRTHKIRAMLVQKKLLESLPKQPPKFESPNHSTRWETLKFLAEQWKAAPHQFMEIEICV